MVPLEGDCGPDSEVAISIILRLRAVMLTSVTTIVGILPLLFETALEAQFLKPMVISLSFGLLFGTFMVLFLLPVLLTGVESLRQLARKVHSNLVGVIPTTDDVINAGRSRQLTSKDPTAPPRGRGNT